MNKEYLDFKIAKNNTQPVAFRIDPDTSKELTYLRKVYSKRAGRRVTTGEICKKLIRKHFQEIHDLV